MEAVQDYMDALRKGRTAVVEENHVVMLGWTDKSLLFIKEVINANESEGGGVVCVLAEASPPALSTSAQRSLVFLSWTFLRRRTFTCIMIELYVSYFPFSSLLFGGEGPCHGSALGSSI